MRPGQRRQPGLEYGIFLLITQMVNIRVDRIPPATLIGVVVQTLLYTGMIKVPWNAEDVCISAAKIFKYKDWRSVLLSNFEHASDMHLYYNMISFIMKGSYLEPLYKTPNFALLIVILSLGCSAMYGCLGYMMMQLTGDFKYFTSCAIGFSATLFALKVILIWEERYYRLYNANGFRVPSTITVWVELILIHLLVPNSSFIGHLSGILVGCLYSYTYFGKIIDNTIYSITGMPIMHEEEIYRNSR